MAKPQVSTLKNGLTVITQHVPGEQVYTNVTVNVGYRDERPDQDNMAHFLEHMAAGENEFLNTQEREEYIQNRRGSMNATTSTERTDYWLQFSKEFAEDAVKLLADGFLHPKFDDKNVDHERNAVETELRSKVDAAGLINYQRIQQTAFPDTQIDKDRFQTVDTVKNHTTQQLKDFKDIHYSAGNMALAVVGDIKHEDAVAWAEKHFGAMKSAPDVPRQDHPPATYRGGMKTYVNPEAPEVNFYIAFESKGRKDPVELTIDQILGRIIGGDTSSRLHQTLVEQKHIARSAGAGAQALSDNGTFLMLAATSADALKETIDSMAEESKKLATTITQAELDKVKNQLIGAAERSIEEIDEIGETLAFTKAVDGKIYNQEEDLAILKSITLEQLQERAKEIFNSPPSISVHGNDLSQLPSYEEISSSFGTERHLDADGLVIQTEQEKAAALARATAPGKPANLPKTSSPAETQPEAGEQETAKPEVTVLENGLKIITQKMPTKQISAQLRVGAGNRHEAYDETSIANIVCETSDAASQRLNSAQKPEAIANLRGLSESAAGQESTQFSIRAANEFTADALQILAENVTAPKFDQANAQKQQMLVKKQLMSKKLDPQQNTAAQMRRVAFPGSQMDKDALGTADQIDALPYDAIEAFKNQHYTADNMILSVVGDVDHAEIVKLAKAQYAGLKAHPDQPRAELPKAKYRGGMEVKPSEESDQVTLRIGFESHDNSDPKITAADKLLSSILGGGFSSRLMASLRSDKGLVYYASAFNAPMDDTGLLTIVTGTHQDKLDRTIDAIAAEVCRLADTVTQEELDAVKNDQLGEYERAMASPKTIGTTLAERLSKGKTFDLQESIDNIKGVTLDDIKARAREIFSTAPSVAAYGKGADRIPSYEAISEKFGKRRSLDASGLVIENAPSAARSVKGAGVAAQPSQEQQRAAG